ncbi:phosphatase PAP2 family protein [Sutcliffiella sp. NPDC057660]|uniref:phosphatase PAP2 family protein n=1 Tax=Sutcliffiella sp. NPDC057660 TaxID=3346199 RepID=UPI0036CDDC76
MEEVNIIYIIVLIVLWLNKKSHLKMTNDAFLSILAALVTNRLIKLIYFRPRPFVKKRVGILIPSKVDSSFPSKHTILVFAFSSTIFFYKRILGSFLLGLSLLTGVSRVWVGSHYPSDIFGSGILGFFIGLILHKRSET